MIKQVAYCDRFRSERLIASCDGCWATTKEVQHLCLILRMRIYNEKIIIAKKYHKGVIWP